MRTARWIRLIIAGIAMLGLTAACGGSPTAEPPAAGGSDAAAEQDPFADILAELEGLEGEERTARLAELAEAEGTLNIYTSNTDLAEFSDAFADTYEIEVSVYRAQSTQVLQRILQESEANFAGSDMVDTNAEELSTMNTEGLLVDYEGPAEEGLDESAQQEGWTGSRLNVYVTAWNTEEFPDTERPTEYADLADPKFRGRLMLEARAFEWYMALSDYFTAEGMSQEEVDALMEDIVANATLITGNTIQAQFLASGEFGATANVYNHLIDEEEADGAPARWRPEPVEPVVIRPNGQGLMRTAQNPAAALLFFEWMLTEGQPLLVEQFRVPARTSDQDGLLDGIDQAVVDVDKLVNEGADWEGRYEELLQGALGQREAED